METQQTRWEERERAGLFALETDEWREKRVIAEDPNTTAETLAQLATTACIIYNSDYSDYLYGPRSGQDTLTWKRNHLLFEAIAVHPNTPPEFLVRVGFRTPGATAALCRNPILPFLLLEQPDFLSRLDYQSQQMLLRETDAPLRFVQMLAAEVNSMARSGIVQEVAQMHVVFAGKIPSPEEVIQQITDHWYGWCGGYVKGDYGDWEGDDRDAQIDLTELGLAPPWAAGKAPREPSYSPPFIEPLTVWFHWTPAPDTSAERDALRRIDPQLRNYKMLTRALRLSATPDDLRDLLRDGAYNTSDISDIMKRAVMMHPSVTGDLLKKIVEKAQKYEPDIAIHPKSTPDLIARLLHSDVASVRRLARRHPNAPADALDISRIMALHWARQSKPEPSPFVAFVGIMQGPRDTGDLTNRAENSAWTKRLEAVLLASPTDVPLIGDPYERTGLDLLNHLARDGSRLVRSVAQTRLADPNWRFTWADA